MNRRFAFIVTVLFALVFGLTVVERLFSTVMTATYADMQAVTADNAIVRGWIPEFLPEDAHSIRERHDLDTNEGWGMFSFDRWDETERLAHWRILPSAPLPRSPNSVIGFYYLHWWPSELDDSFNYFQGLDDHRFWLAIDVDRKVGYFWQDL